MPKIPGVSYAQAIRALKKVGFEVVREGKHTVMSDGGRPRLRLHCKSKIIYAGR